MKMKILIQKFLERAFGIMPKKTADDKLFFSNPFEISYQKQSHRKK